MKGRQERQEIALEQEKNTIMKTDDVLQVHFFLFFNFSCFFLLDTQKKVDGDQQFQKQLKYGSEKK